MKVFKFGGASVKDAAAVKNVRHVLDMYANEPLLVVLSAMGKTTNALEAVWLSHLKGGAESNTLLQFAVHYHSEIMQGLFSPEAEVFNKVNEVWQSLQDFLNTPSSGQRDLEYDRIVSCGEIVSTLIVSEFLKENGMVNEWLDARKVLKTDSLFREAKVDWPTSVSAIREKYDQIQKDANTPKLVLTQGFIGSDSDGNTTTLGREGSDYSAAIFGFALGAESVTIWKDVPGMLNADPKYFPETQRLPKISFKEAIELSYYGATIIHPKTLKPLQNAGIPLFVKSFLNPTEPGTEIQESATDDALIPSYIFKSNQVLISISPRDFSFIVEENLSIIFALLAKERVRINLMQNSALSFSICVNADEQRVPKLIEALSPEYQVLYNENTTLITVRHYTEPIIRQLTAGKTVLVEQRSRSTARFVVSEK
jgi:aspartate kinase